MLVNICCSGSSGSTLLSQQLDRHPCVACGSELNLFSKLAFYERYDSVKRLRFLVKRWGVSSNPYSEVRPVFDNLSHYGLTQDEAWSWLCRCSRISELAQQFESHILNLTGKSVWAEKTPRNIRVIGHFLATFPDAKIIHLVRDPRDVVLSLMNRGFDFQIAAETWMAAVLAIQPYRDLENVLEVRYEDFVEDKFSVLAKICAFIGVDFETAYFESDRFKSGGLKEPVTLESWQSSPKDDVSKSSLNRYKNSQFDFDQLFPIRPTTEFANLVGVNANLSAAELMQSYGYDLPIHYRSNNPTAKVLDTYMPESYKRRIYNLVVERRKYMPKIAV